MAGPIYCSLLNHRAANRSQRAESNRLIGFHPGPLGPNRRFQASGRCRPEQTLGVVKWPMQARGLLCDEWTPHSCSLESA